jgi:hypothetical protein
MNTLPFCANAAIQIVLLVGIAGLSATAASPLRLVDAGKPNAVIVTSARPSGAAVEGAAVLSDHLFQMSGARLPTLREGQLDAADTRVRILVGESTLSRQLGIDTKTFAPGEMLVRSFPGALVLLGADGLTPDDANGTRYAVTTFLEDALGVRFLWPGELGKVVPRRETIDVAALDHRFAPLLRQRRIRMGGGYGERRAKGGQRLGITREQYTELWKAATATRSRDGGWSGWHRLGGTLRLVSGHSFGNMWERHHEQHPEWFAMAPNGSRDQSGSPERARLCVSNRALIESIANDRIARVNETGQKSVTIGPNDGGTTSFCVCPECKKLDSPQGRGIRLIDFSPGANRRSFDYVSLTDRYVHFFNGIAERVTRVHPDVWLTADAYGVYAAPPVKAKLHPNIAIRFVGVSYTDEEKRRRGIADWNAWADAASRIFYRSNMLLAGRRQGIPAIYVHKLAQDFRKIAKNKMIGTDLDSCCHNWATQGLNYYVMAKLLWDPDLDVDALIDDYCRSGFGKGAEPVKRYLLRLEELTNEVAEQGKKITEPFTPGVVAELRSMLDDAARATRDDPEAGERVAFLRAGLEYTDAYCAVFRLNREWQDSGIGRLTNEYRERFRVVCDRNWEASRDILEDHHLAVNVITVAWGSWAYFGRFGWNGLSERARAALSEETKNTLDTRNR